MPRFAACVERFPRSGDFTFATVPFANHNDRWVLRDLPERTKTREWLARALQVRPPSGPG